MAAKNYIKVALVTLLTLALMLCAVPMAFATDTVVEVTTGLAGAETSDTTSAETGEETQAPVSSETGEGAKDESAPETTGAADADGATDTTGAEEEGGISTGTIIGIVIVAVIVIAVAVYCIKNKEKVAKFFREVRSECKKIVWTPAKTVKKNTIVVLVIMVVCVIVIAALDLLFNKGIVWLGKLI